MQRMETSRAVARPYRGLPTLSAGHPAPAGWLHPRFQRLPPPVIVMGMHRSGTSLVAGMLGALGVYVGPEFGPVAGTDLVSTAQRGRQTGYAEAAAFFRLNELLLRVARCSWCRVEPFLRRRSQPAWAAAAELLLRVHTGRSLLRDFLQPLPETYQGAWGWKDPRNSLTLPLWRRLFPEARIIHVIRDSESVARSLHHRAVYGSQVGGTRGHSPRSSLRETARRLHLLAPLLPDPCLDLDYCRELSRIYRAECARVAEGVPAVLEVHYEEILASPEFAARRLAGFTGVDRCAETLRRAGALVLRER